MADNAIDVPIPEPAADKPVEVVLDKAKGDDKPVITADDGIKSLREQVEQAKRDSVERLAAKDRIIADAFKKAQEAEREVATVKLDQVGTIIESLTQQKDTARRDYRSAMEAGDYDKAAEAQERIAMTAARMVEAEKGKIALSDEVKNPPRQAPPPDNDPVERVAQTMSSQRSANWIRNHREVIVDGQLSPIAMEAHYGAVRRGLQPDSDAYFKYIEDSIAEGATGGRRADVDRAPISAPVDRSTTQTPGAVRPGAMRLEADEVRTAIDTFAPLYPNESRDQLLKRYVENKQALIDENKIARR